MNNNLQGLKLIDEIKQNFFEEILDVYDKGIIFTFSEQFDSAIELYQDTLLFISDIKDHVINLKNDIDENSIYNDKLVDLIESIDKIKLNIENYLNNAIILKKLSDISTI